MSREFVIDTCISVYADDRPTAVERAKSLQHHILCRPFVHGVHVCHIEEVPPFEPLSTTLISNDPALD